MRLHMPDLAATIERRILINYRVDPAVAQTLLPASLHPQLIDGSAVAGVCLIRLGSLRPAALVRLAFGWHAENAAHRIAVEWNDSDGTLRTGVYIPERHTASWLAVAAGERLFPGIHHHARFTTDESPTRLRVNMTSASTSVSADVLVAAEVRVAAARSDAPGAPENPLFATLADASDFFRTAPIGWSPTRTGALQGLALSTSRWHLEAATPVAVTSSFFDALPPGSATLDSAYVMRNIPVTWSTPATAAPTRAATRRNPAHR
ncbi:DUF2071 domain-containing protein [Subtercola sp. RTI3]|uniref:DUF2071 domain-containing protein n=1 Tax=Subtercola sp. RTI3 TaxID=3048639 RepID=UPI002B22C55C|nr:DUF2071 domain-containing protein [Subtercola sp. RTI3]MEA9985989.1 DUF2071 domain-containing protein [Subtercola sp. RTI3]